MLVPPDSHNPQPTPFRKLIDRLPSWQYVKLYAWVVMIFLSVTAVLSVMFGQYMGYETAWAGGLIVAGMVVFVFTAVFMAGIAISRIEHGELWPALCLLAGTALVVIALNAIREQPAPNPLAVAQSNAALPEEPAKMPVFVEHGPRAGRRIALTFDACSNAEHGIYDEAVIDALVATRTSATLFLGGKWMLENPTATRDLASYPLFEVGTHGYHHPHMKEKSDEAIKEELVRAREVFRKLTGKDAALFRPPFGEYDNRVINIAASQGISVVEYDLPSGDPDPNATRPRVIAEVTGKARGGSIVVMHMNGRGWHTAEALPEIIAAMRKRGFEFVTVGELMMPKEQRAWSRYAVTLPGFGPERPVRSISTLDITAF